MFRRTRPAPLTIWFEGQPLPAAEGESIAAAMLAAGIHVTRSTAISGAPRGPYCMMGACFDCLAVVDGRAGVQTCMTPVRDGMQVARQHGARTIGGTEQP